MKNNIYASLPYDPAQVGVSAPALLNLFGSLRQLCRRQQSSTTAAFLLHRWEGIPARLQREIMTFGSRCGNWDSGLRFAQYLAQQAPQEGVAQGLERMEAMEDDLFACIFFGYEPNETNRALLRAAAAAEKSMSMHLGEPAISPHNAAEFLQDIPGTQRTMVGLLRAYWRTCFSDIWDRLSADMEELCAATSAALAEQGLGVLGTLMPELTAGKDAFTLRGVSVPYADAPALDVYLSAYDAPQLCAVSGRAGLICAAAPRGVTIPATVPDKVLLPLSVLADETRLRIFRMLWQSEATTKGIADTLGFSPSTVSMHLKLMREAGLVDSSKVKKYVFYHLRRERIDQLNQDLQSYLRG